MSNRSYYFILEFRLQKKMPENTRFGFDQLAGFCPKNVDCIMTIQWSLKVLYM